MWVSVRKGASESFTNGIIGLAPFTRVPGIGNPKFAEYARFEIRSSLWSPKAIIATILATQQLGLSILNYARSTRVGMIRDRKTGEERTMLPGERRVAQFLLGGAEVGVAGSVARSLAFGSAAVKLRNRF
jgi:hypothetical protein